MFPRNRTAVGLALLLALVIAVPALAGGWAVITLDELPAGVVAGEPITVGFTVLQHGRTPMINLDPTILARNPSTEEQFDVFVKPEGKPGHYSVEVIFPSAGNWEWTIKAFTMEQKMPVLNVAAPVAVSVSAPVAKVEPVEASSPATMWIVRVLALGIGAVGAIVAYRRRSTLAVALTAICLVAGVGSFWTGTAVPAVEAESASVPEAVSVTSISQVELGRQLFVAKGCITCHVNSKVPDSDEYWTINSDGATDLSNFSASPEILRIRLHDPTQAKSDTQMPNLGLSGDEIEALIAFINSD